MNWFQSPENPCEAGLWTCKSHLRHLEPLGQAISVSLPKCPLFSDPAVCLSWSEEYFSSMRAVYYGIGDSRIGVTLFQGAPRVVSVIRGSACLLLCSAPLVV